MAEVQGSLLYVANHRRDLLCVTEVRRHLLCVTEVRRHLLCVAEVRRHLLYILGQVSGVLPKLTEVKENLLYDAEVWGCLLCVAEVPGGPHTHGGINMEWPRGVNCIKDGWRAYIVYITSGRRTVRLGSLHGLYERFLIAN